jgi:hypothetical protein
MTPEEYNNKLTFVYNSITNRCNAETQQLKIKLVDFYNEKKKHPDIFGIYKYKDDLELLSFLSKLLLKNTNNYYIDLFNEYYTTTNISKNIYYEFQKMCYYGDNDVFIHIIDIIMEIERFNVNIKYNIQKFNKYVISLSNIEHANHKEQLMKLIEHIHRLREIN